MNKPSLDERIIYSGWRFNHIELKWVKEFSVANTIEDLSARIRQLAAEKPMYQDVEWMIVEEKTTFTSVKNMKFTLQEHVHELPRS